MLLQNMMLKKAGAEVAKQVENGLLCPSLQTLDEEEMAKESLLLFLKSTYHN